MGITEKIKSLCDEAGITINKLEQETGIGRGSVARWNDHEPSVSKVMAVAKYFNVTVDGLLDIKKDPSTTNREEISEELFDLAKELQENYDLKRILFTMRGEDPQNVKNVADMLESFRKRRDD